MNIIIDTHIFLWLASEPERIADRHMRYIENPGNTIFLSTISLAEISIKQSIGRLKVDGDLLIAAAEMGIDFLDFDAASAIMLGLLPMHHRDPFDRMILAQSLTHHYPLISVDNKFSLYECTLL